MEYEYVINVTKTGVASLDGKWIAVFTRDTTSSGKFVTFCALRKYKECNTPFAGCSVKHPKDEPNDDRGLHDSFKRAVKAMLDDYERTTRKARLDDLKNNVFEVLFDDIDTRPIQSRFMGAFWIVMGRPGYKKSMELLPKETLAKLYADC